MANTVKATLCSSSNGYGLTFTCTGPDCITLGNPSPYLNLTCGNTTDSAGLLNISCGNKNPCDGVFFDNFTISTQPNGSITSDASTTAMPYGNLDIVDLLVVNSSTYSNTVSVSNGNIVSPSGLSVTAIPDPSTASIMFEPFPPTSASATATTSSLSSSSTGKSLASLSLVSNRTLFGVFVIALLFQSVLCTHPQPKHDASAWLSAMASLPKASVATLFGGVDSAIAAAENPDAFFKSMESVGIGLATAFIKDSLPPIVNIEVDLLTNQREEAAKDTLKALAETAIVPAEVAAIIGTDGAALPVLLHTHVLVGLTVDGAFAAFHYLTQVLCEQNPACSGSGALPGQVSSGGVLATPTSPLPAATSASDMCNVANFPSSPIFYQSNEFGTDAWRACKSCCVDWVEAQYGLGQSCGCCILEIQYTNPLYTCCSDIYFHFCCSVDCGGNDAAAVYTGFLGPTNSEGLPLSSEGSSPESDSASLASSAVTPGPGSTGLPSAANIGGGSVTAVAPSESSMSESGSEPEGEEPEPEEPYSAAGSCCTLTKFVNSTGTSLSAALGNCGCFTTVTSSASV